MHRKDISIATQVAFNTAVGLFEPAALLTNEGQREFVGTLDVLSDALFQQITANEEKYADPEPEKTKETLKPSGSSQPSAEQMVRDAFPGTTEETYDVEIVDKQGDIPAWAAEAFIRDGVRKVYDNRGQLANNPSRPWFRDAAKGPDGKQKAYWPPKKG